MQKNHLINILPIAFLLFGCQHIAPPPPRQQPPVVARFDRFQEVPITSITPAGWIKEFLVRQNEGLTGRHEILSYPYDTCLWAGLIPRKGDHGQDWWRYEQTAYLSDGIIRLGYLLRDRKLTSIGQKGVDYILAHPMKNDRLGHPFFESQWPMAVYFRVMQADYLATRNPKLLEALRKHYLSYSVDELINGHRHIVNLEGILWTYGQTGDKKLLELAEKAYHAVEDEIPLKQSESAEFHKFVAFRDFASPDYHSIHGVTYMEEGKIPAILYIYTGQKKYLAAATNAFKKLDRDHMLPDGVPSSNEFLVGKNPLYSHETCNVSDYTWSLGYLLMSSGNASWADHIERAAFNAGPGSVSKDFKNLQYFSSVNQMIATGHSNHNHGSVKRAYGSTWMAYWPCHETECCAGNVHRFMPNYLARMWMRNIDGGLVASLYGPSAVEFRVNNGKDKLKVTQKTNYPFSDTINFTFHSRVPVATSFTFRIPGWCSAPSASINGKPLEGKLVPSTFKTVSRTFENGDQITLHFPMATKIKDYEKFGSYVERGPLLFSYPIPEAVTVDKQTYTNLRGKKSPDPVNFPALDIRPSGPWNYALATKNASDLKVVESAPAKRGYPFDLASAPIRIEVPVKKVKNWNLREGRFTPPMPKIGQFECESRTETITLLPYGCSRLRLSVFPVAPTPHRLSNLPASQNAVPKTE